MAFDPEIHHQYMASHWSQRKSCTDIYWKSMNLQSDSFRSQYNDRIQTVSYGNLGPRQEMDIVLPETVSEDSSIFVYIHGGYWTETTREMHLCTVKHPVDQGYIAANVGYDQAPSVSLKTIVEEIRESYVFLCKRFPKSRGMIIQGHSAGGHLACMLLSTEWGKRYDLTNKIRITQVTPISGVYDLRPVVHIDVGADLKLTPEDIEDLSPLLQTKPALENISEFKTKVTAVVAQYDPPVFKEKAKEYLKELQSGGAFAELFELKDFDHFDIISELTNPEHPIHLKIFTMAK